MKSLKFTRKLKMKRHLIPIILCVFTSISFAECSSAVSAADEAYTYARRAYRETSFDDAQNYMRRARNAADSARSYAQNCSCPTAESYLDDAYRYARRGYNASDMDELEGYARRASYAAEAGKTAASYCN